MELNIDAAQGNPFLDLSQRYLGLHRKSISQFKEITSPVEDCRKSLIWAVQKASMVPLEMQRYLQQDGVLQQSAEYHLQTEGKLFRAQLALAISHLLKLDEATALQLACVTEFTHNASLVHDDIQDQDTTRRNQATVWKQFGVNNALLLGDLLLSKAYELLGTIGSRYHRSPRLISLLGEKIAMLIQGQSDELASRSDLSLPLTTYERIAICKTGGLLSFPVEAALVLSGKFEGQCTKVSRIFDRFGIAYQIHDDLADLCAPKKGREPGSDLREGRVSAVNLAFWQQSPPAQRRQFEAFFLDETQRQDPVQVATWVQRLADSHILEISFAYFEEQLAACRSEARELPQPLNVFMSSVVAELEQRIRPEQGER